MANSKDLRKMEMAEDLQNALDRGKVKYMVVQQRFTKADDIGEFTIKEFDITR